MHKTGLLGLRMHPSPLQLPAGHQLLKSPPCIPVPSLLIPRLASANSPPFYVPTLPALPPFPPISLSVCLIAGDGHVVYLTQNRTPLLFQRVEPPSPAQDGGPGLNNALPPPETTETVNSLWVGRCWSVWLYRRWFVKSRPVKEVVYVRVCVCVCVP